jgi:hypothetical protein
MGVKQSVGGRCWKPLWSRGAQGGKGKNKLQKPITMVCWRGKGLVRNDESAPSWWIF